MARSKCLIVCFFVAVVVVTVADKLNGDDCTWLHAVTSACPKYEPGAPLKPSGCDTRLKKEDCDYVSNVEQIPLGCDRRDGEMGPTDCKTADKSVSVICNWSVSCKWDAEEGKCVGSGNSTTRYIHFVLTETVPCKVAVEERKPDKK